MAPILADVRKRGDAALLEYARKFDGFESVSVRHSRQRIAPAGVRGSRRIGGGEYPRVCADCSFRSRETASIMPAAGSWARSCGRSIRWAPIFPPGRYPLPSTLLMTVIPAQVAGVQITCVACPSPSAGNSGHRALAGRNALVSDGRSAGDRGVGLWNRNGAEVDRIVGPGNIYVAAAKKLIAGETGIDFVAGPTEIVIIAAEGNARWIAADMLAQAEHDVDASSILLTTSRSSG